MATVGGIASDALDKVALKVTDAILTGEFFEEVVGAGYNSTTGTYTETPTSRGTCRAVIDTVRPVSDVYPDHIAEPGTLLVFIEGITTFPEKGWVLRLDSVDRHIILPPVDILGAGSIAYVLIK